MLIKYGSNDVEQPSDGAGTDDPYDTDNEGEGVLVGKTLNDTVDRPDDVEHRNAKDELCDPRKIVNALMSSFIAFFLLLVIYLDRQSR